MENAGVQKVADPGQLVMVRLDDEKSLLSWQRQSVRVTAT
jgi:hypothetical protein